MYVDEYKCIETSTFRPRPQEMLIFLAFFVFYSYHWKTIFSKKYPQQSRKGLKETFTCRRDEKGGMQNGAVHMNKYMSQNNIADLMK